MPASQARSELGVKNSNFRSGTNKYQWGQGAGDRQIRSHNCGYAERLPTSGWEFSVTLLGSIPRPTFDLPFLVGTIPKVKKLADSFRAAGSPVVYLAHVLKRDYSDAAFPYWRLGMEPGGGNRTHCVEGTWGAQILGELTPGRRAFGREKRLCWVLE